MRRTVRIVATLMLLPLWTGCANLGRMEAPDIVPPGVVVVGQDNPLFVPLGPTFASYRKVFEGAIEALGDQGFEIADANFYDGHIESLPRVSPGLLLPLKPGSPDLADRLLYSLQTYRDRAFVTVMPAEQGGYFIKVRVFKELEDLPRPVRATAGGAIFRTDNDVARQYEVVDPTIFEANWIPKGFNTPVEQLIIQRLKKRM